ncbi:RNA 3'-phosphate cyclase [Capsaspora owczarzaki ATCC 30864]|uniref:RNA 3'-terminal phosphate cyclase n=1 Tax=Capsaspora owczarzaki (strain ATCC 30864) TaxID=595528 RepID=A0A0D2U292_CAPO3|nr:RNA 3'-phosphate cyclase [Capsaspora owczarzaki ATCC 30864]KJE89346.1 RNA 3'-phosphate cyclase [Capsaspora owczarzaki ATCC 30864]|eukprot:XP_004365709.2 RNA 3'-phosphate cyclase [Capsaspora owczarzaki ATCC 30864]
MASTSSSSPSSSSSGEQVPTFALASQCRDNGTPFVIDGSTMEGGGQVLRNGMGFAALQGIPIHINHIRAGRSKPGLRAQHLCGIELVSNMARGHLTNASINSTSITFVPGAIAAGRFDADIGTAGATMLLVQIALPCALFAPGQVALKLTGGTNAEMAPQVDYTVQIFRPIAQRFGFALDLEIRRRGYFPRGGGEIALTVKPIKQLNAVTLTQRGTVTRITGRAFVAGTLQRRLAEDMAAGANELIRKHFPGIPVDIAIVQEPRDIAAGNGSGILLVAHTSLNGCLIGASALGAAGQQPKALGKEAATSLIANLQHGGCVDEHLQDQLIIFMALAHGVSKIKTGPLTMHTETAIHFARQLTSALFTVTPVPAAEKEFPEETTFYIECVGSRHVNAGLFD